MVKPIVKEPHPILHQKAHSVRQITEEVQGLIDTMIETMHMTEGVGLAANQNGSRWNILVASPDGHRGRELVLINARIIDRRGKVRSPEGCLSVPGISAELVRAAEVTVQGLDPQGKEQQLQASGLLAKILQHETDHLAGHLYLDRLRFWERKRLLRKYQSLCAAVGKIEL